MITDLSQFTKKSGDRLFELGLEETSFSRPRVWLADSDDVSKQIQMTINQKSLPKEALQIKCLALIVYGNLIRLSFDF